MWGALSSVITSSCWHEPKEDELTIEGFTGLQREVFSKSGSKYGRMRKEICRTSQLEANRMSAREFEQEIITKKLSATETNWEKW
ncbi:MAG TPA: hypothetical protein DCP92_17340 [Nitrospiraceae bacterium]|nr:hypothetical protein [Nitrospiraceae bacterium]